MAVKKFFTGPEVEALSGPLEEGKVKLLVNSFKIAARVANAAWRTIKKLDATGVERSLHGYREAEQELRAALHDYSPGNWPPAPSQREYAARRLEELYEVASNALTREAVLEKIYEFTCQEYET